MKGAVSRSGVPDHTVAVGYRVRAGHTGDYFLSAMADLLDTVAEDSEVNNGLTAAAPVGVVRFR